MKCVRSVVQGWIKTMIITICSIIVLILGIILWRRSFVTYNDIEENSGFVLMLFGGIGVFTCIIIAILDICCVDAQVKDMKEDRANIEYRLEQIEIGPDFYNGVIYKDIQEYNQKIETNRKACKDPWVNWFFSTKIADLDYIVVDGKVIK